MLSQTNMFEEGWICLSYKFIVRCMVVFTYILVLRWMVVVSYILRWLIMSFLQLCFREESCVYLSSAMAVILMVETNTLVPANIGTNLHMKSPRFQTVMDTCNIQFKIHSTILSSNNPRNIQLNSVTIAYKQFSIIC